ncbi:hypothetical protein [Streptomyces sp. NPDC001137]|uniref:hypothetical protein n=1 Tax=Streptomyces sp. NPDC001137 TaxID=3154378 RepID=UPI00331851F9
MTTLQATPTAQRAGNRPMGALLASVSLVAGPALIALALATFVDPWNGNQPDYGTINSRHTLLMWSFNLAALSFPFLFGSVVAIAAAARRSRLTAGTGLAMSMLGLAAMYGNSMLSVPLVLMNGIDDHAGLDHLATRLDSPPLAVLWCFPLYFLGSVLLAVALWRARSVPRWAAVGIGLGGFFPVAIVTGIGALALPIAAARIAGSIPIVKSLLAARKS